MPEKFQSLAELLGSNDDHESALSSIRQPESFDEPMTAEEFATKILESQVFRTYIINGLTLGELPSAIVCRLMDYGWGKPLERVVHSGPNGGPLIAVVERVIIDTRRPEPEEEQYTIQ